MSRDQDRFAMRFLWFSTVGELARIESRVDEGVTLIINGRINSPPPSHPLSVAVTLQKNAHGGVL
jgi:hypothetical protein